MPREVNLETLRHGTTLIKRGFAKMQKGGVVMDVTNAEQARIAEEAGAVAVMALERVPADIRKEGGVARMSDPKVIEEILDAVTIPVMAKARIGHLVEARILETMGVDMIDESEVLTPADPFFHIDKHAFTVPFVCGARTLGEATRRVWEGCAMIRTKGEAGTGDIVEAVRHRRQILHAIQEVAAMDKDELVQVARSYSTSYEMLPQVIRKEHGFDGGKRGRKEEVFPPGKSIEEIETGLLGTLLEIKSMKRLPVVDFAAGGIATPADAALMMQLGNDGVFVGSGIFKSTNPAARAKAIVEATTHWDDPKTVAEVSKGLGDAMRGISNASLPLEQQLATRGW
ncbi:MAG: pyridoxal 5-phosphate synthase pdxS subunit [Thermoplasmata archaeon]|jgi:pyridoxal 5'-phosphate synthase pdxS subunit|nr:pyridoxal 5-phosphate synthase pdxS subunit [Thermoplasmata archaeon]